MQQTYLALGKQISESISINQGVIWYKNSTESDSFVTIVI